MALNDNMTDSGPDSFYAPETRTMLEDYMTVFRTSSATNVSDIPPDVADRYQADLNGLLMTLNVPYHLHWLVMRMNYMTSFFQVTKELRQLLIPDEQQVTRLVNTLRSSGSKKLT